MKTKIAIVFLLISGITLSMAMSQVTILSGPKQASYYQFVGDIASALNSDTKELVINKASAGAADNFDQLIDPKSPIKVAMMQSDYLYFMQARDLVNNTDKTKSLKVIVPLANEEIHIITKKKHYIKGLKDLRDKTVAIGTMAQGTYATANLIKDRSEVYWKSRNIHFDDALKELAFDNIDAFFIVGSAPIEKVNFNPQIVRDEPAIVPLHDFNDWAKNYSNDTIYAKDYAWLEEDIPTFGVRTILIVNESKLTDKDREDIKSMVNGMLSKQDVLKANGHPKWKEIDFGAWSETDWPLYK
jgi:TRAP transporter TAXI family solute receptor